MGTIIGSLIELVDKYVFRRRVERRQAERELRAAAFDCARRLQNIEVAHTAGLDDVANTEKHHLGPELDRYARLIGEHPELASGHTEAERDVRSQVLIGARLSELAPLQQRLEKLATGTDG
jgi:hypothetical protein